MMRLVAGALTAALLALVFVPQPADAWPAADACADNAPTDLYLSGGNALTTGTPAEGSAPFPAQAKFSVALVWLVGAWSSEPVGAPLTFGGNIDFSIWAQGSGPVQVGTRFQVYFGVNDLRGDTAYSTDSQRLSSTPKELKGTASGVSLELNTGDTITMWIYVSERGTGGSVVFGGACPSRMTIPLRPLEAGLEISARPGELRISGGVWDIWGIHDILEVTVAVLGPFPTADEAACGRELLANRTRVQKTATLEQLATDETETGLNFTYTWRYDQASVAAGQYMVVVVVETLSNSSVDASAWTPLRPSGGGFSLGGPALLVLGGVAAACALGAVAFVLYRRSGRGAGAFLSNRSAVVASGAAVIIVVASLGLYLSLGVASQPTERAPGFSLRDVDGKPVTLEQYRGSVVVLDMMATWCPTCNQEIPELKAFKQAHPEAVVISIDVDRTESAAALKAHMQSKGASWIYCMDTDNVLQKYSAHEIPKIVVVNPSGYVTFVRTGLVRADELSSEFQKARSGSAPILSLGGETGFAALAFLAGVSAFFSPCAFPLLPGYMTYYLGRGPAEDRDRRGMVRKAAIGGLVAALGVLLVYGIMGLLVAGAGEAVKAYAAYLAPVVAALIVVLGIVMLTGYELPLYRVTALFNPLVDRLKRGLGRLAGRQGAEPGQYTGLLGYGAGYGAASLGCHAPIFIAVVMAGLVAGGVGAALLAFVMYALGMGLILVLVTVLVGMARTALVKRMTQWMPLIKKVSGAVLVVVGVVLIYSFYVTMA
ncbi:MAG: redoxin domain-containing protein [Euryarchaeota archaeon]|nr:redoxin domain-containing protein [Euryarchaeota archaeon]